MQFTSCLKSEFISSSTTADLFAVLFLSWSAYLSLSLHFVPSPVSCHTPIQKPQMCYKMYCILLPVGTVTMAFKAMRNYNGMLWWSFLIRSLLQLNSPLVIIRTARFHTQSSTICPHSVLVLLHTTAFSDWSWQTTQWSVWLQTVQCGNEINISFGDIVLHSLHLVQLCRHNHVDSKNADFSP